MPRAILQRMPIEMGLKCFLILLSLNRKENYNSRPFKRWAYWKSEIHRNYNSCPSARGILDLDTLSAVRLYNYNSRHSARNYFYFRQNNNISVSDITTLAHAGIKKKLAKGRCSYNSRSSTRNSSVKCKRFEIFEMPKRRCDYNSFQSHNIMNDTGLHRSICQNTF